MDLGCTVRTEKCQTYLDALLELKNFKLILMQQLELKNFKLILVHC